MQSEDEVFIADVFINLKIFGDLKLFGCFKNTVVNIPDSQMFLPIEMTMLVSEHLLSLRSLMHFSTVLRIKPTAKALALAFREAVPSWVDIPMDEQDPKFFIALAKWFFDPKPYKFTDRTYLDQVMDLPLFPSNLQMHLPFVHNQSGYEYFTRMFWIQLAPNYFTRNGRELVRSFLLGWKEIFTREEMVLRRGEAYMVFIDHLVNSLDHAFVLDEKVLKPAMNLNVQNAPHWTRWIKCLLVNHPV